KLNQCNPNCLNLDLKLALKQIRRAKQRMQRDPQVIEKAVNQVISLFRNMVVSIEKADFEVKLNDNAQVNVESSDEKSNLGERNLAYTIVNEIKELTLLIEQDEQHPVMIVRARCLQAMIFSYSSNNPGDSRINIWTDEVEAIVAKLERESQAAQGS